MTGAVVVAALLAVLMYWNQHLYYRAGKEQDPAKKIKLLEGAKELCSSDRVFYELGKAYFALGIKRLSETEKSEELLQKSLKNFRRSLDLNPADQFAHFNYGQALLYSGYVGGGIPVRSAIVNKGEGSGEGSAAVIEDTSSSPFAEYKKAALLAGHNSEIYFEVGKLFLSRWGDLSEGDRTFTVEILRKIAGKKDRKQLWTLINIWEMSVGDYKVMEKILPEDPEIYRIYARFLGEKSLSLRERQRVLAEAERMEFEEARDAHRTGMDEFQSFQIEASFGHFQTCVGKLEGIRFYQDLAGPGETALAAGSGKEGVIVIDRVEYESLMKSALLHMAKCRLEQGAGLEKVEDYLQGYLELETSEAVIGELQKYLVEIGAVKESLGANFENLDRLAFELLLHFKQNRYRDIIKVGRIFKESFVVVPQAKREAYVRVLQIVGDSFQKVDYLYDAGEFYSKALEIDPGSLETLVRMRENFERLNEAKKIRSVEGKIEKIIAAGGNEWIWNGGKAGGAGGGSFVKEIAMDRRKMVLALDFEEQEAGEKQKGPLEVSVVFNGRVVWEDYVGGETKFDARQHNSDIITIPLMSRLGKNTLAVSMVNNKVNKIKISVK